MISASPNPVPPGPGPGTTTITWDTHNGQTGQVFVSEKGGPERLVAGGRSGSKSLAWIRPRETYDFRLYKGKTHQEMLAHVEVTH